MGQEVWGFNQPDARVLKAFADQQRHRPMPGLDITWPGAMMPSVRPYIVIPTTSIDAPQFSGGGSHL